MRRIGMKMVLLILIGLLITVCVFARGESEQKVNIRIAHFFAGGDLGAPVYEKFLQEYADLYADEVNLEIETLPSTGGVTEYRNKIRIDMASDNLPDVFSYYSEPAVLQPFAENDLVVDINDYFVLSKTNSKDDYPSDIWDFVNVGGSEIAIPIAGVRSFGMANMELFNKYGLEIPKTYEELREVAAVFSEAGIVPLATGSRGGAPGHTFFGHLWGMHSDYDEDIKNLHDNYDFSGQSIYMAAKAIEMMSKDGVFPKDTVASGGWDVQSALYNEGKAAMVWTLDVRIGTYTEDIVEKSELFYFPLLEGADVDPSSINGGGSGSAWCINKKSFEDESKREYLVALVDLLNSDSLHEEHVYASGIFSVRESLNLDSGKTSELYSEVIEATSGQKIIKYFPVVTPDAESDLVFRAALDELFAGIIDADQFVTKVQEHLDKAKLR